MSRHHNYYVYMLASKIGGTLYVGVTNDHERRVSEHRLGQVSKFTRQYGVLKLVWYEAHTDIVSAIRREKRLKRWERGWKIALIEELNPHWSDLLPHITVAVDTGSPGLTAALRLPADRDFASLVLVKPGDDSGESSRGIIEERAA